MGISAAPPNHPRHPARDADPEGWLAIVLTVVSVTSFALPALLGVSVAWLAIALGAALLTLVLLMLPGRI